MQPNREWRTKARPFVMPKPIENSLNVVDIWDKISVETLLEEDYTLITLTEPISEADAESTTYNGDKNVLS